MFTKFKASKKATDENTEFNWNMKEFGPSEQKQEDPVAFEEELF